MTKLGFQSDLSGLKAYETALDRIEKRAKQLNAAMVGARGSGSGSGSGSGGGGGGGGRGGGGGSGGVGGGSSAPSRGSARPGAMAAAATLPSRSGSQTEGFFGQFVGGMRGFASSMAVWNEITDSVGQFIGKIAAAALLVPRAGDAMTKSIAAINSQLEDTPEAERVYEKLYQAVRISGASLEDSAKSFAKWNITLSDVGKTSDDTVDLITGLQAAFAAAGKGGSEVNSIVEQLGDALSAKKLSGDEFRSLKEAFPEFILALRKSLGKTSEELEDLADKQKLSLDLWLEPLMAFARGGFRKLADAPLTVERAWSGLATTFRQLLADYDKAFKLSERLAKAIKSVSDMLERWRGHVKTVKDFVDSLGSANSSLLAMAVVLGVIAAGSGIISMMVSAVAVLALTAMAAAAAFLLIEDFFAWIQGKDSIIGDVAGSFQDVQKSLMAQFPWLEQLKSWFLDFQQMQASGKFLSFEGSEAEIKRVLVLLEQLKAWFAPEGFLSLEGSIKEFERLYQILYTIGYYVAGGFKLAWDGVVASIKGISDAIGWLDRQFQKLRGNIESQRGSPLGDPGGGAGLGTVPQLPNIIPQVTPGAAIGPSSFNSAPVQNNDINIQVPVTASGASGAEVAAGARSGVAAAARDLVADLGGVARGLTMSMPLAETAAA